MYLEHFGLAVNPFGLSPKLDFLYKSSVFEESMAHLIYGLDNSEAIVLITGAIGTGKTMALQSFLSHLGPQFSFALVTNTRVNSRELLKLILEDLGVEFPMGVDKSDLLILFKDYLLRASRDGRKVLVVVDEAQNLSRDVLEEVRLLTNLGQGESQPVQIILLGQPELEQILNRDDLAQLRQRIRVHYRLETLNRAELAGYLNHRMSVAGCDYEVFSKGAVERIFAISKGVPRVVNTLAGEALLSAFVAGHRQVQAGDVEEPAGLAPNPPPPEETPSPAFVPPVAPAPEPTPVAPAPQPKQAPVMAQRPPRDKSGARRGWFVAVLLVVLLVAAYVLGYLSPLVARVQEGLNRQPAPVSVTTSARPEARSLEVGEVKPNPEAEVEQAAIDTVSAGAVVAEVEQPDATPAAADSVWDGTRGGSAGAAESTAVAAVEPGAGSHYYIHISSFRAPDRAGLSVARLVARGLPAVSEAQDVRGTVWYRVYIGPYASHEAARVEANALTDAGRISYYKIVELDSPAGS